MHPDGKGIFLFDNAPSHRKVADDALNVDKMNVSPGRKQPKLRDTEWEGCVQRMVDHHGISKGMKIILEERGVDTKGMKALKTHDDFSGQKTILEDYNEQ